MWEMTEIPGLGILGILSFFGDVKAEIYCLLGIHWIYPRNLK